MTGWGLVGRYAAETDRHECPASGKPESINRLIKYPVDRANMGVFMLFEQKQNRRLKVTKPLHGAALFPFNKPLSCKKSVRQFGHALHPLAQRQSQRNVIRRMCCNHHIRQGSVL